MIVYAIFLCNAIVGTCWFSHVGYHVVPGGQTPLFETRAACAAELSSLGLEPGDGLDYRCLSRRVEVWK